MEFLLIIPIGFIFLIVWFAWTIIKDNHEIKAFRKEQDATRALEAAKLQRLVNEDLQFFDFETELVSIGMPANKRIPYLTNRQAIRRAAVAQYDSYYSSTQFVSIYSPDRKVIRLEMFAWRMNEYDADAALKYCLFTKGATKVSIPRLLQSMLAA
jgi:hypothetical protein